ncbi:MAG: response regulator [Thermoanaerobaculia bacterium]
MSNPKVLIIDDDLPIRTLMQNVLREFRFDALLAGSGHEAVRVARETRPDVILVDLNMPDMSGRETIEALRKEPGLERTPVLILTGEPLSSEQLATLGAWAGVQKPFDLPRLIDQIRAAAAGTAD